MLLCLFLCGKSMQGKGGAHYELWELMRSGGGVSWRENRFYFSYMVLNHKLELIDFTDVSPSPSTGSIMLWGWSSASWSGAPNKVNAIMKKEDFPNSSRKPEIISRRLAFVEVGCSNRIIIPKHTRGVEGMDQSGQNWGFGMVFPMSWLVPLTVLKKQVCVRQPTKACG